jgi:membrane associated rhomboid family serine protease
VAILVVALMPGLYLVQAQLADGGLSLAFRPSSLWDGQWWPGLLTSMFVHGGWGHVAMNAVAALAFAPPVARLMRGARGVAGFLLFYVIGGLVATAGYAVIHRTSDAALVGASGAVFGLMGAGIRTLGRGVRALTPLGDRRFLTTATAIMGVNAVVGLIGLAPGMDGARVAWEAHAFGFVFGALAIEPWVRLFDSPPATFASPGEVGDADL